MSSGPNEPDWLYDAGEPWARKKHRPSGPEADVRLERFGKKTMPVTTCPAGLSREDAQHLLRREGIPAPIEDPPSSPPDRIYGILDGVPYEARPTLRPAATYHAFPMLPEDWKRLPEAVRGELENRAQARGENVATWFHFVAERLRKLQR